MRTISKSGNFSEQKRFPYRSNEIKFLKMIPSILCYAAPSVECLGLKKNPVLKLDPMHLPFANQIISFRLELIPRRRGGQPLRFFLSISFDHQYALSLTGDTSCLVVGLLCLPIAFLSFSTAASVDLCGHNSFPGVFVLVSHLVIMLVCLTVPSRSGLSYFVSSACHSQHLSDDLIPCLFLQ